MQHTKKGHYMATAAEIFVGRRHELEALCTALDATCSGDGRLVLLAGEPGIGKTRTALELTAHAASMDARIVWGRCHEEAGAPPYWPWMQILRAVTTGLDLDNLRNDLDAGAGDIADIVPDIRLRLPDLDLPATLSDPSGTRFRLFGSIARFLINTSRRQSLALVLDDLHWADVPSLRLLEFMAQEMADSRLLVIGTYRETELSRHHRLSDTLGALARVPHAVRLHLSGLNAEDVRQFVATAAGMVPPAWLTSAIHSQTEGNPLFVREVVRFLAQEGHFNGTAPATIRLPEGVRDVIGRRLNLLPPICNEILAVAAVIGREFTFDVLVRASQPHSEETVLEALDEAVATHIVEETTAGQYQFTHALVRITLYDELRTGQRRRLHHAVGEAMEAVHRRDPKPVLADLAYHFRVAGLGTDVERAVDYATRAGESADAALAFEDAIAFFQNALDMLDTMNADDPERRCNLLLVLGNAERKANGYPQALESLRAAADIARSRGMRVALAEAAYLFADTAWRHTAHSDSRAGLLLEEALIGLPETETSLRIRLMGALVRDRLHTGRVDESKALASQAIAMARNLGDPAALATSLAGTADFPWSPDETEQRLAEASEMVEMGERANDLEVALRGHFRRVSLLLELGDIQAVVAATATIGRLSTRIRQPFFVPWELGSKATMALMRGALDEAERLILQTMRIQLPFRTKITDPVSLLIFTLRREQGRLRELGPMVAMFVQQNAEIATWRPGLALLYVELGDLTAARAVFDQLAAEDFGSLPRDGRWATCLMYLAEVCAALDDRNRASVIYRLLLPWSGRNVVMGGGTGCWGSSDRFLGILATIQGRWTDAEHHFGEALAMNERIGAFAPLAHAHCDFADMLVSRAHPGDAAKASTHLSISGQSAASLGLIALAGQIARCRQRLIEPPSKAAVPDNLTVRELEVLRLIAIGRGNADIALVLEIGQSTVATHVHNILVKTGCANRTEAAAYAVRHGLQAT
jgi:DNA-binding CsgD family transcriptional regulator/tetratricopeptide (TPR) repeat protein